jgi:hypothetical protein
MSWIRRYRIWTFVRSALWLVPILSMLLGLAVTPLLRQIDQATGWSLLGFGVDGARALLAMLAASMLSLLVFVLSALLIAVQVASAQLTPRVIAATFLLARPVKFTIGLFVFTFMLSIGVLGRTEESVLQLSTTICILASLASIAMFLLLVDYALKSLRPVSLVARVAAEGFKVVEDVYPHRMGERIDRRRSTRPSMPAAPERTISHAGGSAPDRGGLPRLSAAGRGGAGLVELVCASAISSRRATCSTSTQARRASRIAGCGPRWPSVRSGRWSRIPRSPSGSWSTSRPRRSRPPSTIPPRRCSRSTRSIPSCVRSEIATSIRRRSSTRPQRSASPSAHPIGRIT